MNQQQIVPIFFTNKRVIFPQENLTFIISVKISEKFGVIAIESELIPMDNVENKNFYGTLVQIQSSEKNFIFDNETNSTTYKYKIKGFKRFKIIKILKEEEKFKGIVQIIDDSITIEQNEVLLKSVKCQELKQKIIQYFQLKNPKKKEKIVKTLNKEKDIVKLCFVTIAYLNADFEIKKQFLQLNKIEDRIHFLNQFLNNILPKELKKNFIFCQNFHLTNDQIKDLQGIVDKNKQHLPKVVYQKVSQLIIKLTQKNNPYQYNDIQYLETILRIPWNKKQLNEIEIKNSKEILNKNHFGLEDVKQKIIQFLAIQKLRKKNGNTICFCGPPGVGKSTLAKSIANALNRKFTKISIGGLSDDSILRGHRKTYIGAFHGEIIESLIRCESMNPVILLDEIEKTNSSIKGNPAHVLLEILDPVQNCKFFDHYIGFPIDISDCFFVATANSLKNISPALRDRMEVIHIEGYSEFEKIELVKSHLLTSIEIESGFDLKTFEISDQNLQFIIRNYTSESGVRNLKRKIGEIVRAKAVDYILQNKPKNFHVEVDQDLIKNILGQEKFFSSVNLLQNKPGISQGLAYSSFGGSIVGIEVSFFKKKFGIECTGNLGDIAKETIQLAFSFIKCNCINDQTVQMYDKENRLNDLKFLNENFFHIHFIDHGIQKDGPSAGLTICAAIFSSIFNQPISKKFSFTGEISLTGSVLPVGGIQQKILAAHQNNINNIICSIKNKNEIEFLKQKFPLDNMKFFYLNNIKEMLHLIFSQGLKKNFIELKPKLQLNLNKIKIRKIFKIINQ